VRVLCRMSFSYVYFYLVEFFENGFSNAGNLENVSNALLSNPEKRRWYP
jgi:hypothetical protein